MLKTLKMLTLSALVGFGGLAVAPVAAEAQGLYLQFGDRHHGGKFGLRFGESGRSHRHWDRGWDRGRCSQGEALNKAARMGFRNPRVVDTSGRSITVRGRVHGEREFVTFSRRGNCRVIG